MKNIIGGIILLGTITACEKNLIENPPIDSIPVKSTDVISKMTNDFGWDLFLEVARDESEENVLISPLSVQTVMSMAVNGADGQTMREILKVLGCDSCDVSDLNQRIAELRIIMEEQSGHPRLTSANGFFYDPHRVNVYDSFINAISSDYRAGIEKLDFSDPFTPDLINSWVKQNTGDKIDKIIEKIEGNDIAFIINALHFRADWSLGFSPYLTHDGPFLTGQENEVTVDYMQADRFFSFIIGPAYKMIDMPFKDSTYSLSVIQSATNVDATWIPQISASDLISMWDNLEYMRAYVAMPKLDIEYKNDLRDELIRLGIVDAFADSKADFSRLGSTFFGNMYISKVDHKAVLKVDEKGAEGAAVTSAGIAYTSAPPVFVFNKPFVIVLRHTETNTILFAGRINDPS